jgi:hypothetical protein
MSIARSFPVVTSKLRELEGFDSSMRMTHILPFVNKLQLRYGLSPVDKGSNIVSVFQELAEAIEIKERPLVSKETWSTP